MAMVPYKNKNKNKLTKRSRRGGTQFNPNQFVYELGLGAVEGVGNLAVKAVRGIVSAFQSRGASRQEITSLVAPLAKSLSYTSRKPKFSKADGGLSIEHIETVSIRENGHHAFVVSSSLFKWLKNVANQFEEYQIKLWFAWNPVCPATESGQVQMAFDYDPDDADVGAYAEVSDYFNTADHCINAIWAPGAISPQKSEWLKTGTNADARFYSPGRFHINVTDSSLGYLTVKYQVSLRKPQPVLSGSVASFTGSFSTSTGIFANFSEISGDKDLISAIANDSLSITPNAGYKVVVWSTDGNVVSVTNSPVNARNIGVRTGSGASWVTVVAPGTPGVCTAVVTAPGGPTAYRVTIHQVEDNPLYFGV